MNVIFLKRSEKIAVYIAVFSMIYLPILWGIGFSYRWYGEHPWPGVALYAHFGLLILLLVSFFNARKVLSISYGYSFFVVLYLLCAYLYSFIYLAFSDDIYKNSAFNQSFIYLTYFVGYVFIGFFMLQVNWSKYFVALLIFVFFALAIFNLDLSSTIPVSLYNIYGDVVSVIPNYQLVSLSILFTIPILFLSSVRFKRGLAAFVLFLVFLTGGRSEFLGAVLTMLYLMMLVFVSGVTKRLSVRKDILFGFLILPVVLMSFFYIYVSDLFLMSSNRNFQILNMESNTSWIARQEILEANIVYIKENPVLGSFGSHFNHGEGSYIHNILSVWQQYGVVPFIIYFGLLVFPFIKISYYYFKLEYKWLLLPLAISFYCFLLMLVSKSYQWSYAGLSVGAFFYVILSLKQYGLVNKNG